VRRLLPEQPNGAGDEVELERRHSHEKEADGRDVDVAVEERGDDLRIRSARDDEREQDDGGNDAEERGAEALCSEDLVPQLLLEGLRRRLRRRCGRRRRRWVGYGRWRTCGTGLGGKDARRPLFGKLRRRQRRGRCRAGQAWRSGAT